VIVRPRISACLIARDEEAMLPACLASLAGAVDEVIVVDTGSRDRTAEIAIEAGAKLVRFAWCDDFAAARNASLDAATGDWILILDADERLGKGAAVALRAAVRGATFDCAMLPLHDANRLDASLDDVLSGAARLREPHHLPRLLRNCGGLRFTSAIHENVLPWLRARGMKVAFVAAPLIHYGAIPAFREARNKSDRNVRLLEKACAEAGDDPTPFGYLAHELLERGKSAEAAEVIARGWALLDGLDVTRRLSVLRLATAKARLELERGDADATRSTVERAIDFDGKHPDLSFLHGLALETLALATAPGEVRTRDLEAALRAYDEAIGLANVLYAQSFVIGASGFAAFTRKGSCALALGDPKAARDAFAQALAAKPGHTEAELGLVEAAIDLDDPALALAKVELLLGDRPDGWLLAALAFERLGMAADVRTFLLRARERAPKGYATPRRRERHIALLTRIAQTL
jgi:tetratricopeptide (TPR) repeat protein